MCQSQFWTVSYSLIMSRHTPNLSTYWEYRHHNTRLSYSVRLISDMCTAGSGTTELQIPGLFLKFAKSWVRSFSDLVDMYDWSIEMNVRAKYFDTGNDRTREVRTQCIPNHGNERCLLTNVFRHILDYSNVEILIFWVITWQKWAFQVYYTRIWWLNYLDECK